MKQQTNSRRPAATTKPRTPAAPAAATLHPAEKAGMAVHQTIESAVGAVGDGIATGVGYVFGFVKGLVKGH